VGKVLPPSVDRRMLTKAALIGAAAVPETFHVTVRAVPAAQETAVLGAGSAKAAPLSTTVSLASARLTPPPPAWLSRTLTWKLRARLVVGRLSPRLVVLLIRLESLGKVRVGLAVGLNERNRGLAPLSAAASVVAAPRSRSSQS